DGVVHAAAETRPETFRPLRDLDPDAVARHFGAKVTGARVLEQLLGELAPEQAPAFCVLFSSTSSILGGITFGSYAAANAALTALGYRNNGRNNGRSDGGASDRSGAGNHAGPTRWIAASWDTWAPTLERIE